jgi:hypothetical protein
MTFDAWRLLVSQAGADLTNVNNFWLNEQYKAGISPVQVAQAIRSVRPQSTPPILHATGTGSSLNRTVLVVSGVLAFLLLFPMQSYNQARSAAKATESSTSKNVAEVPPSAKTSTARRNDAKDLNGDFSSRWKAVSAILSPRVPLLNLGTQPLDTP